MLETTLSVVGILVVTQICKKWIVPKFGATGVHIFVFVVSLAVVLIKGFMTIYPSFGEIVLQAGQYLASAITLYHVVIKPVKEKTNLLGSSPS